jgi:valyl-tRNA synthetase
MLGDGAVAVHPSDERYAPIVGKLCEIPVGPKEHRRLLPIITDEYPDPDFGSGAVKITGAHDFNDYQVAKRGGIPMYSLMDTKGAMRADGRPYAEEAADAQKIANGEMEFTEAMIAAMNLVPEDYRGLDRFEARKKVIADISSEGLAVMHDVTREEIDDEGNKVTVTETVPFVENKPIMQPFGDRSKVVIEPMLTDQWFVDAAQIAGPALDAVRGGDVKIMPESGEKTFYHWLDNIEPWCISRQLWWGHQVPVWFDADGNQFCAATEAEAQALAGEGVELTRDPDVLDTWFSSGLWPFGTLGWPQDTDELAKYYPGDVLITGADILFFWVARMMMMSQAVNEKNPFHTVYLHGLVRDEKGKKMSKTTGNVIDPLEIIDEFGADALRFTNTAMASLGGVLKMSKDRIAGYRNFGTKIWNAARFAEMNNAVGLNAGQPVPKATLNKWIMGETAKAREAVDAALSEYRFNDAALTLYAFTWGKVCDWYVEFAKPLFNSEDEAVAQETRETMSWVIDQCLILLHPIMPFITEELWGELGERQKMLVHGDWPTYSTADLLDPQAEAEMSWVIATIEGVRSARAQMRVPAGLYVPMLVTDFGEMEQGAWSRNEALIKRMARIEGLEQVADFPKGCITIPVGGATFGLPLADIIDVAEEKARLEKAIGKLAKELGGLRGRLNNPKFVASAPEEVVAEAKENLAAREADEAKLQEALARLAEIG